MAPLGGCGVGASAFTIGYDNSAATGGSMQKSASFNLDAVKAKIETAKAGMGK